MNSLSINTVYRFTHKNNGNNMSICEKTFTNNQYETTLISIYRLLYLFDWLIIFVMARLIVYA